MNQRAPEKTKPSLLQWYRKANCKLRVHLLLFWQMSLGFHMQEFMGHFECLCYKNVSGVYMLLVSVISKLVPLFSKKVLSSKDRTASNLYQVYIGSFFTRLLSLCFLLLCAPACCSIPFLKLHTWILVIGYLCMQQIAQLNMCFDVPNCNK